MGGGSGANHYNNHLAVSERDTVVRGEFRIDRPLGKLQKISVNAYALSNGLGAGTLVGLVDCGAARM
jgi:hypothetical protein